MRKVGRSATRYSLTEILRHRRRAATPNLRRAPQMPPSLQEHGWARGREFRPERRAGIAQAMEPQSRGRWQLEAANKAGAGILERVSRRPHFPPEELCQPDART